MKKYLSWLTFLLLAMVLVLACLPQGVEMHFAAAPEEGIPYYVTFASYFSLIPFGYANFGPLVTAVLTVILFLLTIILIVKGSKKLAQGIAVAAGITTGISLTPILYGSYTLIGGLITAFLLFATVSMSVFLKISGGAYHETK